jgi:hypothetical protein
MRNGESLHEAELEERRLYTSRMIRPTDADRRRLTPTDTERRRPMPTDTDRYRPIPTATD